MAPFVTVDHRPSRRVSQIALPVTVDVQPPYQPPALDWRSPYRRVHHLAVPVENPGRCPGLRFGPPRARVPGAEDEDRARGRLPWVTAAALATTLSAV